MSTFRPGHPDPLVARLRAAGCVFAEEEARLLRTADASDLEALVARRIAGEPLETVLGWAELDGLRIPAAPGAFVPRQRSLLLVRLAAEHAAPGDVVVDLCCGTGALGAAVARRVPGVELWSSDLDPVALTCARAHLPPERVLEGDLWDAVPTHLRGRLAVVVCNAPYVPTDAVTAMPREAREHEHRLALDGGPDGLALHRRLLADAPAWLRPDGVMITECAPAQTPELLEIAARHGLVGTVHRDDERGACAVSIRRPAP